GPYWNATNPDGIPDRNPTTGQIVSSEINHNAVGLVIDNLTFGLFLGTPTLPGDPIRYIALKASASNIAFVGVPGLTATAENIDVEINMSSPTLEGLPVLPVINFSALPGGGYQVPTGAVDGGGNPITVNLDYSTPLIAASSSWIQLNLFGVLDVQGSIAFALGPQQTVTLQNSNHVTLSTMTVGAANVSGFVGYNGPYITDAAGDTNSGAHGLSIDNASLGLFFGFDTASPQVYIGAHLDIPAVHLVGIPGVTLAGTAQVDLDLGIGLLNGGTAINFAASFPFNATTNPHGPGFAVNTGDPLHPVVLGFTGFTVNVNVGGTLGVASVFSLAGVFSLQADSSSLKVFGAGALTVGPDIGSGSPLLSITALGVFILNGQGLAADVDVNASLGISDLGLTVNARVILNTTSANQTIEIPNRLLAVIQQHANSGADATLASFLEARLVTCADNTMTCYTVNGAAPKIFTTPNPTLTDVSILLGQATGTLTYNTSPSSYLVVVMSGSFNFLNFATATGVGAIEISGSGFQLAAQLSFTLGPINFSATGFLDIESSGVYAHIGIAFDLNLLSIFDANLSGTLDINTQGGNHYFQLNLTGSVSVLSILSLNGSFQFVVSNGAWSVPNVSVSASLGSLLSLSATGDIYSTGKFDLHLHGEIDLGDCSGVGCVRGFGDIYASFDGVSAFSFSVGGGLGATVLGVSLGSVSISGSVSGNLGQSVTLYLNASGIGDFLEQVWGVVGSVASTVCSWAPWPFDDLCNDVVSLVYGWVNTLIKDVSKSFSIPIATFSLPGSLANVVTPPTLATLSGGVLTLNVGSRGSLRNVSPTVTDETYEISSTGPGAVKVTAFGTNQTFSGVSSITGDFGAGHDALILDAGMVLPVTVRGAGNATVVGRGTNLNGLPGTGGANSLIVVDGGPNPLTVNGVGSATLYLTNLGTGTGTLSSTQLTGFNTSGITYGGFGSLDLFLTPGSDTLNVVTTPALTTAVTVNGVAGQNDVVNVSDAGDTSSRSGTLTSTQLTGLNTNGLTYSNILQLNITLGTGAATFTVASTTGQTIYTVSAAPGSNAGTVTVGNDLTQIQGPVTINGGGVDTLIISDTAASGHLSGSLSGTQLIGLGLGAEAQINMSNIAALTVSLGGSNNTFSIVSTASGITTTLNAGVSNNTVVVQSTSGPTIVNAGSTGSGNTVAVGALQFTSGPNRTPIPGSSLISGVQGTLTVNGHTGDTLQVDGRGDTLTRSGTLSSSLISGLGLGAGGVGYSGIGSLTLSLGSGVYTFAVTSTITGSTTLAFGGGNDTVDLSSLSGAVILNGGNGNDTVTVHSTNTGSTLTVNEGTGANWVAILATNGTVIVNEGSGANVVEIGSHAALTPRGVDTGGNVNGVQGAVTVVGDPGNDSLYLDETGEAVGGGNGTLTASTISGLGLGAGITYSAQGLVSIALGSDGTEFAVQSTSTQTVLNTGGGNDTVDVSSNAAANTGTLSGLLGGLTIDGQGGTGDILNISDFGDAAAGSGRLSSSSFTGFGTAGISYAGFEVVNLQLGQNSDTLAVVSTYLQAVTTIRAGPGSDTINVFSDLATLSGIAGHLVVDGQGGTDTLNVSDAGDASGQTGALTSTDITGLGTGGITYSNLEQLNITLGSHNDTFTVKSTSTSTMLSTGAGSDAVTVSSDLGVLSGLAGHLVVDGQGGTDALTVSDTGDGVGQTGSLTSTDITGLGTAGISYANFEQLSVTLGSGNDTFTILSTITGPTTVNGGPGDDSVDVETIAGPTFVNGQAGNDTITVNGDLANPSTTNGIGALLTLDGGAGLDTYVVN
ncbi:MAG TPA: hypothetical protein VGH92_08870, partial [Gaiellaceae bacterium]